MQGNTSSFFSSISVKNRLWQSGCVDTEYRPRGSRIHKENNVELSPRSRSSSKSQLCKFIAFVSISTVGRDLALVGCLVYRSTLKITLLHITSTMVVELGVRLKEIPLLINYMSKIMTILWLP
jgi:hypothetical protein